VPLYFAAVRSVVKRSGVWIMVDDERLPLEPGECPQLRRVRFRTLGCYPLTGAIESAAATPAEIVAELRDSRRSERQGRLIGSSASQLTSPIGFLPHRSVPLSSPTRRATSNIRATWRSARRSASSP